MKCEDFESLMVNALGNELSSADRSALDAHLAECDTCRHEYEGLQRTLAALHELPGPQRVTASRQGNRLVIQDTRVGWPRGSWWTRGGPLRYAAGLLMAFTAGYALHAGLTVTRFDESTRVTKTVPAAIVSAHLRDPTRPDLAKCIEAVFGTRQ